MNEIIIRALQHCVSFASFTLYCLHHKDYALRQMHFYADVPIMIYVERDKCVDRETETDNGWCGFE